MEQNRHSVYLLCHFRCSQLNIFDLLVGWLGGFLALSEPLALRVVTARVAGLFFLLRDFSLCVVSHPQES